MGVSHALGLYGLLEYRRMECWLLPLFIRIECVAKHRRPRGSEHFHQLVVRPFWRSGGKVARWISHTHARIVGSVRLCFRGHSAPVSRLYLVSPRDNKELSFM